tara:strand:- start:100076 stop:102253 length:2178 start_codon:yes stop_codon:yes gene_type:complete
MKTPSTYQFCLLFILLLVTFSCVEDDEFELPEQLTDTPELNGEIVSISSVHSAYFQAVESGETIVTFEDTNTFVSGFVISNDEAGNFFEELIIQDASVNPKAGLKLLLDVNPLFTRYQVGRTIFIKLDGLSVGLDSGVITLGVLGENRLEKISAASEAEFLVRSPQIDTIVPTVKTISEIKTADLNTLVQLPNAQFTEADVGKTFANEPGDEFDGDRLVESCSDDGGSLLFQTSTFADFKGLSIPDGSGTLTAVLTKNFFGDAYALVIRNPNDIFFDSPDRCEPKLLDPGLEATTTFAAVRARYLQAGGYVAFGVDEDPLIIEGYVASSDESGNFFDELFIQNTFGIEDLGPNNPRLGLRIIIDKNDSYQIFPVGRKVYVKLNGLAVTQDAGILTLGLQNVSKIEKIPEAVLSDYVVGGQEIESLVPLRKTVTDLDEDDLNTLVALENMQFTLAQLGFTYAGEPIDNFDGERNLESCDDTGDIRLFTSTFANFKSQILDPDSGMITALYTTDFSGEEAILVVRDLNDISFSAERCDPPLVDCGTVLENGNTVLFSDFFETQIEGSPIAGNGWTNVAEEGTQTWEAYFDDGTNASLGISANIGSFMSGDDSTIAWLITPMFNFDAQEGETLNFKTSNSFADSSDLEVLFSADWDGNPMNISTATWSSFSSAVIVSDKAYFGDWIPSGNVDLSCIEGSGYIGFRYSGSGNADFDGTFELDEIEVRAD